MDQGQYIDGGKTGVLVIPPIGYHNEIAVAEPDDFLAGSFDYLEQNPYFQILSEPPNELFLPGSH